MARYFIGVDLGGTNLRSALIQDGREIIQRCETATLAQEGCDAVIDRMANTIRDVIKGANIKSSDIEAIGIGAPGPLDARKGIVIQAPNMKGWDNIPLADRIEKAIGIKTFLENDANAAGWGEYVAGAGRGCENMLLMTLGTGIGGAIILNGKLITGPDWTAGEIGHVVILDGGRPSPVGNRGVYEAYASANATVARFIEALDNGWHSSLENINRNDITCSKIFEAASNGDPLSWYITTETARYLGLMAANMANLLNFERCIFSGGMIRAGEMLFKTIREEVKRRAFAVPAARMQILPAELGDDAGLIGAAGCAKVALEGKRSN